MRNKCILRGQVMLQGSRLKTHWRASHPTAWNMAAQDAISESQSLTSLFRRPCQFCGSQAKCTRAHAGQCAALFQVLAGRNLLQRGSISEACRDSKEPAPRRSETVAAYKSSSLSTTPLAKAFSKGTLLKGTREGEEVQNQSRTQHGSKTQRARTTPGTAAPKRGAGGQVKLTQLFGRGSSRGSAGPMQGSWTLRLRLRNPRQLCYLNAGVVAVLHVLQLQELSDLRPLTALCKRNAEQGRTITLSQHMELRSLLSRWDFGPVQRDASKMLMHLLPQQSSAWAKWEARRNRDERLQVVDRGGPIFHLQLPVGDVFTLTEAFLLWQHAHEVRAVSHRGAILLVQLGRYVDGAKNFSRLSMEATTMVWTMVPCFSDGIQTELAPYSVQAMVIHLGPRPTSGHYRALLREGAEWGYSDDGVACVPVVPHAEHQRNAYVLLLTPTSQA